VVDVITTRLPVSAIKTKYLRLLFCADSSNIFALWEAFEKL
jgi:hypothetical protein